jgi:molecular chaperone GrpE
VSDEPTVSDVPVVSGEPTVSEPDAVEPTPEQAPPADGVPPDEVVPAGPSRSISVEDLVGDLERVASERDDYLDSLRRVQAEFTNYRKAVAKRESDARERANEGLVAEMLPVLDACDGALTHGSQDVAPIRSSLLDTLAKQGLERICPTDAPFDPERHEAVMHEPADGDLPGPVVAEVLRVGYAWRGRTLRPAMVRVRG